jgi:hypothetical protein
VGSARKEENGTESRVEGIDHRESLKSCDCAEILIGANEVVNRSGLMEVEGDSQLDRVEGAEPMVDPEPIDQIARRVEVGIEHPEWAKKTRVDVDPEATLELTVVLSRDHTHPDLLGKPRK